MTKFIIGVVVGIFLGTAVGAHGAVVAEPGTSSSWPSTNCGKAIRSDQIDRDLRIHVGMAVRPLA